MKNVFVILTERTSAGTAGARVAVNMSRVQEMWPDASGSTRILMNIPGAWILVMESIDVILQKLDEVNREPSEQREPGGVPVDTLRELLKDLIFAREHHRETLRAKGHLIPAAEETGKINILEYILGLSILSVPEKPRG